MNRFNFMRCQHWQNMTKWFHLLPVIQRSFATRFNVTFSYSITELHIFSSILSLIMKIQLYTHLYLDASLKTCLFFSSYISDFTFKRFEMWKRKYNKLLLTPCLLLVLGEVDIFFLASSSTIASSSSRWYEIRGWNNINVLSSCALIFNV